MNGYTNNKRVVQTFAEFLKINFDWTELTNCRESQPNYNALSRLYLYKEDRLCDLTELGVSNVTEKNCDDKFERLVDNALSYIGV